MATRRKAAAAFISKERGSLYKEGRFMKILPKKAREECILCMAENLL